MHQVTHSFLDQFRIHVYDLVAILRMIATFKEINVQISNQSIRSRVVGLQQLCSTLTSVRAVPPGGAGEPLPGGGVHSAVGLHAAHPAQRMRYGRQLGFRFPLAALTLRQRGF